MCLLLFEKCLNTLHCCEGLSYGVVRASFAEEVTEQVIDQRVLTAVLEQNKTQVDDLCQHDLSIHVFFLVLSLQHMHFLPIFTLVSDRDDVQEVNQSPLQCLILKVLQVVLYQCRQEYLMHVGACLVYHRILPCIRRG